MATGRELALQLATPTKEMDEAEQEEIAKQIAGGKFAHGGTWRFHDDDCRCEQFCKRNQYSWDCCGAGRKYDSCAGTTAEGWERKHHSYHGCTFRAGRETVLALLHELTEMFFLFPFLSSPPPLLSSRPHPTPTPPQNRRQHVECEPEAVLLHGVRAKEDIHVQSWEICEKVRAGGRVLRRVAYLSHLCRCALQRQEAEAERI